MRFTLKGEARVHLTVTGGQAPPAPRPAPLTALLLPGLQAGPPEHRRTERLGPTAALPWAQLRRAKLSGPGHQGSIARTPGGHQCQLLLPGTLSKVHPDPWALL